MEFSKIGITLSPILEDSIRMTFEMRQADRHPAAKLAGRLASATHALTICLLQHHRIMRLSPNYFIYMTNYKANNIKSTYILNTVCNQDLLPPARL